MIKVTYEANSHLIIPLNLWKPEIFLNTVTRHHWNQMPPSWRPVKREIIFRPRPKCTYVLRITLPLHVTLSKYLTPILMYRSHAVRIEIPSARLRRRGHEGPDSEDGLITRPDFPFVDFCICFRGHQNQRLPFMKIDVNMDVSDMMTISITEKPNKNCIQNVINLRICQVH